MMSLGDDLNGELTSGSDFDTDDEEDIDNKESTLCLFCEVISASVDAAIKHLEIIHGIRLSTLKSKFNMDQYSFIKLVNFIRLEKITSNDLLETQTVLWNDEKYLKPIDYEPWLSYDFDEILCDTKVVPSAESVVNPDLKTLVEALRKKCKEQALLLEHATDDIAKMRAGVLRMVEAEKRPQSTENCVGNVSLMADDGYFFSYSHFGIHHEMLSDSVRTISYRDALLNNKEFINGKDVLDIGCGTSVLSIFASLAGAKQVVGIDNSDIIYHAMDIVKKNNIPNVTLIKGRLEDTKLPQEKYDVIVSEWMGYFLLFEGMLDSVIFARDNHLKENGTILPNYCSMSIVGYGNEELYKNHVTFWDCVYGLDMSTMKKDVLHEPLIDIVNSEYILTEANIIAEFDIDTVDTNYSNFSYDFSLLCKNSGTLNSFVGYFDVHFNLPNRMMFSTSPADKPTHWKQVIFFIDQQHPIIAGDIVSGKIRCLRSRKSARSLEIVIQVFGKKYKYYLD